VFVTKENTLEEKQVSLQVNNIKWLSGIKALAEGAREGGLKL